MASSKWGTTTSTKNGVTIYGFTPSEDLSAKQKAAETYYNKTLTPLQNEYNNRKAFSYNYNTDPLYQQYKDQYVQNAKAAAENTQANSAALSGGFGNSYGATAAAQAYQNQINSLNNIIPTLQSNARSQYNQETTDLGNKLNAANSTYATLKGVADDLYSRENSEWQTYVSQLQSAAASSGGSGSSGSGSSGRSSGSSSGSSSKWTDKSLYAKANSIWNKEAGPDGNTGTVDGADSMVNSWAKSLYNSGEISKKQYYEIKNTFNSSARKLDSSQTD